ncbi:uncharacterized protein RCC_10184 [Ramularia collo-cygni]|uniref:DUF2293 domain-containing protein n=1 Tax=Ramularia collo-cygni TaxID=112498 RepID=A0A2D3VLI2_9PEZI|nr:uncharacterized protein RCC_10184 [Ramularia collo-cygni]CZT24459.1 uncharacterized protein RCC_10184 [Ramularia collo-cygni]
MGVISIQQQDLSNLDPFETRLRKRAWNKGPIQDLFPRIPDASLERVLDIVIDKGFTYNLSDSRLANAKRYTSIIVAHVRHFHTDYDSLLRSGVERFEARQQTSQKVRAVLREWCPWDESNEVLERCWKATLVRPEERDPSWDPMDIDDESDDEEHGVVDDPMDLD